MVIRLLFLYSLPLHIVLAFGPRLESLKGGYGSRMSRTAMAEYDDQEEHESQNYKLTGRRYSPYHDDPRMQHDLDLFYGSLLYIRHFQVDSTMFGIDNPFDIQPTSTDDHDVIDFCDGDDCEECLIPEEYKHVDSPIDVLMYFGIQRAKSIITTTFDN